MNLAVGWSPVSQFVVTDRKNSCGMSKFVRLLCKWVSQLEGECFVAKTVKLALISLTSCLTARIMLISLLKPCVETNFAVQLELIVPELGFWLKQGED